MIAASKAPPRLGASIPMWMIVALATFVAAAFAPLSFDEAFWLAITRQLDQGARLYSTAVDHKTPVRTGASP